MLHTWNLCTPIKIWFQKWNFSNIPASLISTLTENESIFAKILKIISVTGVPYHDSDPELSHFKIKQPSLKKCLNENRSFWILFLLWHKMKWHLTNLLKWFQGMGRLIKWVILILHAFLLKNKAPPLLFQQNY